MLSAAELGDMRAVQVGALPDMATHLTPTSAPNAIGEAVITWATAGTSIACRLSPIQSMTRLSSVATETATIPNWMVTMSYSGTVHSGDRLAISGKEYEVLTARADFAWRTALRVECILVEK